MTALTASSATRQTGETLALSIPPEIWAVSTARLFVAAVGRGLGLDDDDVEDLRLAVSEAVTAAVRAHTTPGPGDMIEIRITGSGRDAEVEISSGAGFDIDDGSLSLIVIRALFPDADSVPANDGRSALRFRLPTPATG